MVFNRKEYYRERRKKAKRLNLCLRCLQRERFNNLSLCKICKDKENEYKKNNRERIRLMAQRYRERNREKLRIWGRNYALKHRDRVVESRRKYKARRIEEGYCYRCLSRKVEIKGTICNICKIKQKESTKRYKEKHKDRLKIINREYRKRIKEKVKQRREVEKKFIEENGLCHSCKKPVIDLLPEFIKKRYSEETIKRFLPYRCADCAERHKIYIRKLKEKRRKQNE